MDFGVDTEMSSRFYQIYARTLRRATETHIRVLRCMRLQNKLMARVTLASYENDKRLGAHFPKGVLMPILLDWSLRGSLKAVELKVLHPSLNMSCISCVCAMYYNLCGT